MRSRFTHEGELDHHAHNEHELFQRADEALERQRRMDHAASVAEHSAAIGVCAPLGKSFGIPLASSQSAIGNALPKMPHEEIAERIALKPVALIPAETSLAWPPRTTAATTGNTHGVRSRR